MHEVLLARAAVKRSQGRPRAEYGAATAVIASLMYRVMGLIEAFQANISDDVEVGISVMGSGSVAPFRLRAIKASNPDILIFDGVDNSGNLVQLLQHYSQMALLLVALPKLEERPYRIGFTS